ncbi:MAG TPA: YtxH domain-containing protein [Candidatus Acidoferrum sp.]|jgi:gas vesicle protein|nr:YtxH domain-containing protein [Candidatus Acidoferrum sp.]
MKFTSFLIGLGTGAAVALLFAPRSGEETRELIAKNAKKSRRYAEHRLRDFRDMTSDAIEAGREMAMDTVERGKDVVSRQKNAVSSAVKAAKEAYEAEAT